MRETDLYTPIKRFLESQNYSVKSEIHNCDILAVRDDEEPIVVELKLALNLDVVLQAIDRISLTSKVYIGIPNQCGLLKRRRKMIIKLFRMLGLGLIAVEPQLKTGGIDILIDPGEYRPRKLKNRRERLLGEFMKRVGDPNLGGTNMRKGIMTAYRQRALEIARYLNKSGPKKASHISRILEEPKARDILYRNVYGWFERTTRGVYEISPRGQCEISNW
ncbi:MAG: DUF2161 family putative PD-(D/E)XK-type phosphodiesterase [Chitinispirillia bacterium]|jgi:hypothetical protein